MTTVKVDARSSLAAVFGWLASTIPTLMDMRSGQLSGVNAVSWWVAAVVFGGAHTVSMVPRYSARRQLVYALLLVQTLAGFIMVWTAVGMTKYLAGISLVIVVGELPRITTPTRAWAWVAGQTAILTAIFLNSFGWIAALSGGSAYAGFQAFALSKALLEHREHAAREAVARANVELHATRELLAEHSRAEERLRISRDLHDAVGHHLMALSLQLDVASRLAEGHVLSHVQQAHAITRLLLADVRDVVSQLRDTSHVDLVEAVRPLALGGGVPQVHLDLPTRLVVKDATEARTILRCVQEIITNAARHAEANNVWIQLAAVEDGVSLQARDDGRGSADVRYGNGLTGMRERLTENGGAIEFTTAPGQGFAVRAFMRTEH